MIYLLYDHDEGGPENLIGDTCPVRFHERAVAWLNDRYETTNTGTVNWDWTGTPDELVAMARRKADPDMPERTLNTEDYDSKWLPEVYEQILEWDANGRPEPKGAN